MIQGERMMNKKVGKHDPCPCGSGKKYSLCCGKPTIVSITHIIDKESLQLQKELVDFALHFYEEELLDSFASYDELIDISDKDEAEVAFLIHSVWFVLTVPLESGKTIIEIFIEKKSKAIKRPQLIDILQSWHDVKVVAGRITQINNNIVRFTDTLQHEEYEAYMLEGHGGEVGGCLFGFLLPYGATHTFFLTFFDIPKNNASTLEEFLESEYFFSEEEDPEQFLKENFFSLFLQLPLMINPISVEQLPWEKPIYKEVAELFEEMLEEVVDSSMIVDFGIMAWFEFCERRPKNIKNKRIYAAALHYLVETVMFFDPTPQKQLGKMYNVSPTSISSVFNEMYDILFDWIDRVLEERDGLEEEDDQIFLDTIDEEQMLHEITKLMENKQFDNLEDAERFFAQLLEQQRKEENEDELNIARESAQYLVYQALESIGEERYQLAQQALEIYPNCADAYNILAEKEKMLAKAAKVYAKGMEVAEADLGEAFFKENVGSFWMIDESRGYMRAKFNYAQTLLRLGYVDQAKLEFEELLTLNPNDNQGVRYSLFSLYIDNKELEKATVLLEKYEEISTTHFYNKLLVELLNSGVSHRAIQLFRQAHRQNPFVYDYLIDNKSLPSEPPHYYGIGDEGEAIVYAFDEGRFWKDNQLRQALLQIK